MEIVFIPIHIVGVIEGVHHFRDEVQLTDGVVGIVVGTGRQGTAPANPTDVALGLWNGAGLPLGASRVGTVVAVLHAGGHQGIQIGVDAAHPYSRANEMVDGRALGKDHGGHFAIREVVAQEAVVGQAHGQIADVLNLENVIHDEAIAIIGPERTQGRQLQGRGRTVIPLGRHGGQGQEQDQHCQQPSTASHSPESFQARGRPRRAFPR